MSESQRCAELDQVVDLKVPLAVVLAEKQVSLEQILELRPGVVLELGRSHETPLDVYLNGSRVGRGRAVDIGERLGFRIDAVHGAKGLGPLS